VIGSDSAVHPVPLSACKVYVPDVVTMIDCVVCPPGDHKYDVAALDVNSTLPPSQKVVGPLAEMVGTGVCGSTVTVTGSETFVHPEAPTAST